jgi:hypothetical protein
MRSATSLTLSLLGHVQVHILADAAALYIAKNSVSLQLLGQSAAPNSSWLLCRGVSRNS